MNLLQLHLQSNNDPNLYGATEIAAKVPVDTTTLLKADAARGRLVTDPVYAAPFNLVKDTFDNISNVKKALNGQSNDHNLGKINDFAMKAGGLALAAYLFTKAKTPKTKAMELIGFGAFFSAMAIWPKMFIDAPLKAMKGVSVHQKYEDSQGRKKMFFQDPQYTPWDIYTKDELNKLGDKLNIPQNIHNREEVIKQKAQKIALQGNTLWMMTAGLATPLLSALACNQVEKHLTPHLENLAVAKAAKDIANSDKIVAEAMSNYVPKTLNNLLELYKSNTIDEQAVEKIADLMHHDNDIMAKENIKAQIKELLIPQEASKSSFVKELTNDKTTGTIFKEIGIKPDTIAKLANEEKFERKLNQLLQSKGATENQASTILEKVKALSSAHETKAVKYALNPEATARLQQLDKTIFEFAQSKKVIDNYNMQLLNRFSETTAANQWNKIAPEFVKAIGITEKELAVAKSQGKDSLELFKSKLTKLAKDDAKYEEAVKKMSKVINDFDSKFLPKANGNAQGVQKLLNEKYTELFDEFASKFDQNKFYNIKDRLIGRPFGNEQGNLKANTLKAIDNRLLELRSGFYKMLHTMDVYKRIETPEFAKEFAAISREWNLPAEAKNLESLKEFMKEKALNATIAEHTTKFGFKSTQVGMYDRFMRMMYNSKLNPITENAIKDCKLGETTLLKSFNGHLKAIIDTIGGNVYPHEPNVVTKVASKIYADGDHLVRDLNLGARMDEVIRKTSAQMFNSTKWMKIFGGATAALAAVTLLIETQFGKMNKEEINNPKN